jgi:hypothetical protein
MIKSYSGTADWGGWTKTISSTATNASDGRSESTTWIEIRQLPPLYVRDPLFAKKAKVEPQWCVRCRKRQQLGALCSFCAAGISRVPARTNAKVKNWKRKQRIKKKGRE